MTILQILTNSFESDSYLEVSPNLGCGDTSQIWTLCAASNGRLNDSEKPAKTIKENCFGDPSHGLTFCESYSICNIGGGVVSGIEWSIPCACRSCFTICLAEGYHHSHKVMYRAVVNTFISAHRVLNQCFKYPMSYAEASYLHCIIGGHAFAKRLNHLCQVLSKCLNMALSINSLRWL